MPVPRPPSVVILLSAYNGDRFLAEQLDSLLRQDYAAVQIRVRDDGSTDRTAAILREYADRDPRLRYCSGPNLGVVGSFFELLRDHVGEAEWIAFCDQDDVWAPDKISRAIGRLTRESDGHLPLLYFSRLTLVDDDLRPLGLTRPLTRPPSFGNALTQNIAAGCTMVINAPARRLLVDAMPDLRAVVMHDWWVYLVVSALGRLVYDPESRIYYRQHGANFFGARSGIALWWQRLGRVLRVVDDVCAEEQLREFRRLYADRLAPRQRRMVDIMLSAGDSGLLTRWRRATFPGIYRQGRIDDVAYRFLVAMGRR